MRYCPSCFSVYPNEFRSCPRDQTELQAPSDLRSGMVLRGKYEILEKLGSGGMASVYRARHLAFGEVRAIKVVASRLADDEDFLRRFRNEAVMARRLQHPNAVRVDDLDTTEDGRPFIVMEHVDGLNLREVIRRDGALGLRRSVAIARQVAAALTAAHQLGIVHRDIKPDNILLTGTGEAETAKVLDFGIAKAKEDFFGGGDHVATRTGTVVGTPQYISPEQAMGRRGDEIDGRADLYSLGVVLYEMVTGRLPFESDTAMGIILHHLQTPPVPPHELRPDLGIPEPLSAVLLQALQKDRERRFRTAGAMVAALDGVLALPLADHGEGRPPLGGSDPAATPQPLPAGFEERETRVMPRTPSRSPAGPFSPPPLPGKPGRPAVIPTFVSGGATGTPVPQPTAHLPAAGGGFTPPPLPATPPPLAAGPPPDPGRRKKSHTWRWVIAIGVLWLVFGRRDDTPPRRERPAEPKAAASAAAGGEDAAAADARLAAAVTRALAHAPATREEPISVEASDGEVQLGGTARSREAAEAAERIAGEVAGVTSVDNDIEVDANRAAREDAPRVDVSIPPLPDLRGLERFIPSGIPKMVVQEMVREGHRHLDAGEIDEAMKIFQTALRLDPTNKDALAGIRDATLRASENARRAAEEVRAERRLQLQRERDAARARRRASPPPPPPSPPVPR